MGKDVKTDTTKEEEARRLIHELHEANYGKLMVVAIAALKQSGYSQESAESCAEDIVQNTFFQAWLSIDTVLTHESPAGWLFETLKKKTREYLRKEENCAKKKEKMSANQEPCEDNEDSLLTRMVIEEVIPPRERKVLTWLYVDGYTFREVAEELNMNSSTLATKVDRLKKGLRKKFLNFEKI